jgi:hypothetical protein
MDRLVVDTIEVLQSTLINLIAGQVVYITADDFETLTGDKITAFASEGRLCSGICAREYNRDYHGPSHLYKESGLATPQR